MAVIFSEGEVILAKKEHACGGAKWQVIRVGADYKIKCLTCGRVVMINYDKLLKMTKSVQSK